jgi:hypothetical protein
MTRIIRLILWLLTVRAKVSLPGKEPIKTPPNFLTFQELPTDEELLKSLLLAYCQVFSEPPWQERHQPEKVLAKLKRELSGNPARLVVMLGDKTNPVAGFCWGSVISPQEIPDRIIQARFENVEEGKVNTEKLLKLLGEKPILYIDELAVLSPFRRKIAPIQFLLRPLLELGWQAGICQALFWTSASSKIRPLATYMGFYPLTKIEDLVFMFNPDFLPLLKIAQNLDSKRIARIMGFTSKLIGDRRKN